MCEERRSIVLVDAPASWAPDAIEAELATWELPRANAALYYPRLLAADPLDGGRVASFAPSGAVAGVIARTDTERALWKAPAGSGATIRGAVGLARTLSDAENQASEQVRRERPPRSRRPGNRDTGAAGRWRAMTGWHRSGSTSTSGGSSSTSSGPSSGARSGPSSSRTTNHCGDRFGSPSMGSCTGSGVTVPSRDRARATPTS